MVSPELLRRYPFFSGLSDGQIKLIASISDVSEFPKEALIFEEGSKANLVYILQKGSVDLFHSSEEEFKPQTRREFHVGEINPGEVFGISSMLDGYKWNATARAGQDCQIILIDGEALRAGMKEDCSLGYLLMVHTAEALIERLKFTRVQLAAAWST